MMPKISIIVPVYNVENILPRCIDSILAQTFVDFELLLINDGSLDNSGEICEEYKRKDSRIKVFHIENNGVSHARNLGIIKAQGEWIIYIDSDDYFLPIALEKLLSTVNKYNYKVCTGNHYIEKNGTKIPVCFGRKERIVKNNFMNYFFKLISPRAGTTLFHKSILKKNLFDESLSRYEDLKSMLDIMRTNTFVYIPNCIMSYTLDQVGLSKISSNIKRDFLFSLNFENKTLWERLVLADLINKQKSLYFKHKSVLYNRYKEIWYLIYVVKVLDYIRRILHYIYKTFFNINKYEHF